MKSLNVDDVVHRELMRLKYEGAYTSVNELLASLIEERIRKKRESL